MITTNELVLTNLILSAMLTGLIWTIQVVHYPGFLGVGSDGFTDYQQQHMRTISYVVVPLMLGELVATVLLIVRYPALPIEVYVATAMVVIIWAATIFVSSPLHSKLLSQGYNTRLIEQLVNTNWIRTAAWSIRTVVLLLLTWQLVKL